jgi:hypothetical protein
MTTIAWDGKTLAADRRMAGWMTACKIFPLADGRVMAGAGYMDDLAEVAAWLNSGADDRDEPSIDHDDDFFLLDGGKCYWLTMPFLRPLPVQEGYAAIGSGAPYALAAMACGKTAVEAVEIAAMFDPHTGNGVDTFPAQPNAKRKR